MAANSLDLDQKLKTLVEIVAKLRDPKGGCPWDLAQNHLTLTPFTTEECAELVEAIENHDDQEVRAELGDVLFQVVLHSQLARERGAFELSDVIEQLSQKMIRRHPHVFQPDANNKSIDSIWQQWEKTKQSEKSKPRKFCETPKQLPALQVASKIGRKSRTIAFDWQTPEQVATHVASEWQELVSELQAKNKQRQEEELGDLLFTITQLARHLEIDAESALRRANQRILARIELMLELAQGTEAFQSLPSHEKEQLWERAKDLQCSNKSQNSPDSV